MEDIGVCSQRDRFFGMVGGQLKEIEDVDMANIRRKAVTNLYNRLIKRAVGLMNITVEDLVAAGLDTSRIPVIEYKTGTARSELSPEGRTARLKLSAEGRAARQRLGAMLMAMANNDKAAAAKLLEKYSEWKDENGNVHRASSFEDMTERWLFTTYMKVKKVYDAAAGPAREPGEEG